ncbi:MAG: WxcM-like domain-containing protein [Neisseriaceae bacterium]|nr:MAG: WxcM-like domain-containing protein [Neisseriaceae bacterium]
MCAQLINFEIKGDDRGSLIALEKKHNIPFEIKRVYYLFDTKTGIRRGFHAHHALQQIAICVHGSCEFLMDDGYEVEIIKLDNNHTGLMLPPYVWHEMFNFSPDCVLMVLANDFYDESDYIRSYQDFISMVNKNKGNGNYA